MSPVIVLSFPKVIHKPQICPAVTFNGKTPVLIFAVLNFA